MATDNYQSRYWDMEWVGKLPTDWEFIKNRYIFNFNHGKINLSNDTPVLSLTTTGVKIKTNLNFGKSTENYVGHQLVFPGDLVFTPRDFDQTPILSGVAKEYGCISNLYFVMKTKKEIYNEFVNYFWWGIKYGIEYFKEFSYGMRSSFNRFQFNEITFIKPPIETQKKIVSYLDRKTKMIALIIEKKKKLIELLKEKRISIITQAVTKGLDPKAKMKPTGVEWIGEIPTNWKAKRFKFIASMQYGESLSTEIRELGDVEVYGSNGPVGTHSNANTKTPVIIVGRKGSFGAINLIHKKVFAIDTTYYIDRRCTNAELTWLNFVMIAAKLNDISVDTGVPGLSREIVYNKAFPFPEINEQKNISSFLINITNKLEQTINKNLKIMERLLEYRSSLI